MANSSNFYRFSYVIGADRSTKIELINWFAKSQEYINQYFDGDRNRINKTVFGDCVTKVEILADLDELGMTAMCGTPLSDEEYEQKLQSVIDGSGLVKYLNKVLMQKQDLLKKLADLEAVEQVLRDKIAQNTIVK